MRENKVLPSNEQIEKEALGEMINNNKSLPIFMEKLNVNDFYVDKHKRIFNTLTEMFAEGKQVNLTLLVNKIGKDNLKTVGGVTYLSEIMGCGYGVSIREYIKVLKDLSFRRKSIFELNKALNKAYDDKDNFDETIASMSNKLLETTDNSEMIDDKGLMEIALNTIEERYKNKGVLNGLSSGMKHLDLATSGLSEGELIIIAGRPGSGKSAFMLNYADGLAKQGAKVGILSLEMVEEEIALRRIAYNSLITMDKLKIGNLTDDDIRKIGRATSELGKRNNLIFDCSSFQNILTIRSKAMAMKKAKGLDVLFIDHIGLIDVPGKDLTRELGQVSRSLKVLAKELDISIVVLAQLNRGVEARVDKHPLLSDLRDSGRLEEDANKVFLLYREDYYNQDTDKKDIIEINVAKNRNGETGTIEMAFKKEYQLIADLTYRQA